jgi:uncharacterized protein YaiE (UPF0345 family)
MSVIPSQFSGVTALTKANVYFDGNVVSHSLLFPDGSKKTVGLIRPGSYHFSTDAAEMMEIIAGVCLVKIDGADHVAEFSTGSQFEVPGKGGFSITVQAGLCEYICSFLP